MKPTCTTSQRLLATFLILAWAVPAAGQTSDLTQISLEDLAELRVQQVFGASDRLQPVTEVPSSVTIVTADEISRYGYRTLADILRGVRGFYVTDDRNYSYVGARGFNRPGDYSTRVLLLVNGHRMNDNVYDQASVGRGIRDRRGHVRARRNHPRSGVLALRHQRAVRGRERRHANRRLAERRVVRRGCGYARHAPRERIGRPPARERDRLRAVGHLRAKQRRSGSCICRRSTYPVATADWPRTSTASNRVRSTDGSA